MSDIGGIFTPFNLAVMAMAAAVPGLMIGAAAGAWLSRNRRVLGAAIGGISGFALCLGAVVWWVVWGR